MEPSQTEQNGRDQAGRFSAGNKFATGRPFARLSVRLKRAALNAVAEADVAKIMQSLVRQAADGDVAAIKVLFGLLFGHSSEPLAEQPGVDELHAEPAVELTRDNVGEIKELVLAGRLRLNDINVTEENLHAVKEIALARIAMFVPAN